MTGFGRSAFTLVVAGSLAASVASEASAQRVAKQIVNIKIDVANEELRLEDADGSMVSINGRKQASKLEAANEVLLDKGNVAKIYIYKANPLAYRYGAKKNEDVETADFKVGSQFAAVIQTLVSNLGSAKALALVEMNSTARVKERTFVVSSTGSDDDWSTVVGRLQNNLANLALKASQMPTLFEQSRVNQTSVRKAVCTDETCSWGIADLGNAIVADFKKIKTLRDELVQSKASADQPALNAILLALSQEADAVKTISIVKTFAAAAAKIDQDILLDQGASYVADKSVSVDVSRTALTLDGKETKDVNRYTIMFRPYQSVSFAFGPMFAYTFVPDRSYSGVMKDGQLVIAEKASGEYVGRKIAAVLSLLPTRFVDTPFVPRLDLGVTPERDKVALFIGAGFSASGLFTFGAGYSAIQVPTLDGQKPNDAIESLEKIKTKPKFEQGAYVQISVTKKFGG